MRRIVPALLLMSGVAWADTTIPPTAPPKQHKGTGGGRGGGRMRQQQQPKTGATTPPVQTPTKHYVQNGTTPDLPAPPISMHKEGEYGGVTPGVAPSTRPAHAKLPSKGTLSWIGFEAKDGGAQVFLQSVASFDLTQQVVGSQLFVYLALPRLAQNTWRQVDTRFFDNPLSGIQARVVGAAKASKDHPAHGAGVEVRVTFKNPKDAREAALRTATEADNLYYAYLTFPEGTGEAGGKAAEPSTTDVEK